MKLDLLIVPGCPNAGIAADRLRHALDELGLHDVVFRTHSVTDHTSAEAARCTGSPTILINGQDAFEEPGRAPGLSCRLYRTPDGLAGAPTADQLRQALTSAL
ncbi:hypothetical protein ACH4FX_42285 [Streptomyces sp. NPDC018019]|uniref:hypothetical protein n=1 Tax=Streptomyces sp. NPDC018019 TaxID=3365030 RepID=UPI0037A98264